MDVCASSYENSSGYRCNQQRRGAAPAAAYGLIEASPLATNANPNRPEKVPAALGFQRPVLTCM